MNGPSEPRGIARLVPIRQLLEAFGVRVRNGKRADCPLCEGSSTGTLSLTERLWHCHRCNEGGDAYTLVRLVNRCDFPKALRFVAELAGISLEDPAGGVLRGELAARKLKQRRLDQGAEKLAALERALLRERRDRIHDAERKRLKATERLGTLARGDREGFGGEQEALWLILAETETLLGNDLPAYSLLSFGAPAERARFVLNPELRKEIIAQVRWAGYVRTADGKHIEVLS